MLLTYATCLFAGTGNPAPGSYAVPCINAILDCRYDIAESVMDSAAAANREDPLAPLLRLTMSGIRDVDFDTMIDSSDFFKTFRFTETLIGRYEQKNGISSYSRMLAGLCKGIHSSLPSVSITMHSSWIVEGWAMGRFSIATTVPELLACTGALTNPSAWAMT